MRVGTEAAIALYRLPSGSRNFHPVLTQIGTFRLPLGFYFKVSSFEINNLVERIPFGIEIAFEHNRNNLKPNHEQSWDGMMNGHTTPCPQ